MSRRPRARLGLSLDPSHSETFWSSLGEITDPEVRGFFAELQAQRDRAALLLAATSGAPIASRSGALNREPRLEPDRATRSAVPPLPTRRWAHLEIRESLGRGTYGHVFRALDPRLNREVALKLTPAPEPAAGGPLSFQEARELARVRHPNVLVVHGVDSQDGWIGMWTEFVRGTTLEQWIRRFGPLGATECIAVGVDLCRAAAAVHEAGLVHGDIKCENVMREVGGRVVLTDFGLASDPHLGANSSRLRGTPLYMAPERLRGEPLTVASDIYALGVVLFRILSLSFPVMADTLSSLAAAHARGTAHRLDEAPVPPPKPLGKVIERALAADSRARWPAAGAFAEALASLRRPRRRAGGRKDDATRIEQNLPRWLSRFVGREEDVYEIESDVDRHPLTTLTGAGGCGKSRLAGEAAARSLARAERGEGRRLAAVHWAPLASLHQGGDVPAALALACGVREQPRRTIIESLIAAIGSGPVLLVIDNCEHVLEAVAESVTALLAGCHRLHILATSRERLGLPGERVRRVAPLAVPDLPPRSAAASAEPALDATPWTREALEKLSLVESVRLFIEAARAADDRFGLTAANADDVLRICRRLDGIPLALELAAASVRSLGVHTLAARLENRFLSLGTRRRGGLPHHETLHATIDWSYSLLDEQERSFFRRLSVFAGGCTLEAAAAVCTADGGTEQLRCLDLLSRLINKSLVEVRTIHHDRSGGLRYHLLETIRQYGHEQLVAAREEAGTRERHREHFMALALESKPHLRGPGQGAWLARIDPEHDNLRLALATATDPAADILPAARMASAIFQFWRLRGHWAEAWATLTRLLDDPRLSGSGGPSLERAQILHDFGYVAQRLGRLDRAQAAHEESLDIYCALDDRSGTAGALWGLAYVAQFRGELDVAASVYQQVLALREETGNKQGMASTLNALGRVENLRGNGHRARDYYEQALAVDREIDDQEGMATDLNNLGTIAIDDADYPRALALFEESLAIARALGSPDLTAQVLLNQGVVCRNLGEHERARTRFEESLDLRLSLGDPSNVALCRLNLAELSRVRGKTAEASAQAEAALDEYRRTGHKAGMAMTLQVLGHVALAHGEHGAAAARLRECLALYAGIGNQNGVAEALVTLARLAAARAEQNLAARLLGAAEDLLRAHAIRITGDRAQNLDALRDLLEKELGSADFARERGAGAALGGPAALAMAMETALGPPLPRGEA